MPPNLPRRKSSLRSARLLWEGKIERIDHVIALDEFDLETAALVREHMRLPGMARPPRATSATSCDAHPGAAGAVWQCLSSRAYFAERN